MWTHSFDPSLSKHQFWYLKKNLNLFLKIYNWQFYLNKKIGSSFRWRDNILMPCDSYNAVDKIYYSNGTHSSDFFNSNPKISNIYIF